MHMPDSRSAQHSDPRPFQFTGRIRSFRHAIAGILRMIRCQHNAWIHALATLIVLAAALFFQISAADWCWIILAISIVWTAEALNTAFEFLAGRIVERFVLDNGRDGTAIYLDFDFVSIAGLHGGDPGQAHAAAGGR